MSFILAWRSFKFNELGNPVTAAIAPISRPVEDGFSYKQCRKKTLKGCGWIFINIHTKECGSDYVLCHL